MQCLTCQGEKKHAGVDCYDCSGTGYNMPSKVDHWIYQDCTITVDPKPIGSRAHDWEWVHKDYEGPTPSSEVELFGTAGSLKECYQQIDEMIAQRESEQGDQDYEDERRTGKIWCGAEER
tara:strand:+ start:1531 stop:1890 length:360 start_codon:yes stop_codon:yes gene_type:complete